MLSGSAYIGQLYDATTDQLLFDRFLWQSPIEVKEAKITSVETDTYLEENIKSRIDKMGVGAGLFISLTAGTFTAEVSNLLKYGFCKKLLWYKWTSDQLNVVHRPVMVWLLASIWRTECRQFLFFVLYITPFALQLILGPCSTQGLTSIWD